MRKLLILLVVAAALSAALPAADPNEVVMQQLVAIERSAMEGWRNGNPDPLLAVSDPDITYFHTATSGRLDGLRAVKELVDTYRGRALFETYEILDAKVQLHGDVAILTYHFVRKSGEVSDRWNATQVYRRGEAGWRVIHSHWSLANPPAR